MELRAPSEKYWRSFLKPKSQSLRIEGKGKKLGFLRMNEKLLLIRLKHKSEKALAETIEKYTAYVTTIIREIVNCKATPEDIEELVANLKDWNLRKEEVINVILQVLRFS